MKKHRGMRSLDVVILLKIASLNKESWYVKDLAFSLGISQSEVSESLNRSKIACLLSADKKALMRQSLLEFLEHGLKYVYPPQPGGIQRGLPTAHSAPPLNKFIEGEEHYVWIWAKGSMRGQTIEPLHPSVPEACNKDEQLYELLSLVDGLRVGRTRERRLAMEELRKRIA